MSKLLVFGHQNPDTDATAAAIAYAYFLRLQGEDAEAVVLGELNHETQYALNYFEIEAPRLIHSASEEVSRVALVDHNEPVQSVEDIHNVTIDYVVDHHRIANFETAGPLYYRAEPIGSTSSILYKMYQEQGYEIPTHIAGMLLSAIISDTLLFKSPTCTPEDIQIGEALANEIHIDLNEYGLAMLKAGADISDKTALEIVDGDAKSFDMNHYQVRIGQVNTVGFNDVLERKEEFLQTMTQALEENNYAIFLLVVTDILTNDSIGFVVGDDYAHVEEAFKQKVEDYQLSLPGIVSRKKQVVPPLREAFSLK